MTYTFCGNLATGVTLELADGSRREIMLYPGRGCDLPEDHAWVKRMVRRGLLAAAPAVGTETTSRTQAATEQTEETE